VARMVRKGSAAASLDARSEQPRHARSACTQPAREECHRALPATPSAIAASSRFAALKRR